MPSGVDFSFASYYNDHMVLQKSPIKANIWGYLRNDAVNHQVTVDLNNKKYNAAYIKGSQADVHAVVTAAS